MSIRLAARVFTTFLLSISLLFGLSEATSKAQETAGSSQKNVSKPTSSPFDVTILVFPQSYDRARLGIAYHTDVAHDRVRREIAALAEGSNWQVQNNLAVLDHNTPPESTLDHGTMTIANCTVTNAPQIVNNTPQLLPYIKAFQTWKHIEVVFLTPPLPLYTGVSQVDNDNFRIEMQADQNGYTYDITIRKHSGALPDLTTVGNASVGKTADLLSEDTKHKSGVPTAALLMLAGAGIAGGSLLYLLFTRRSETHVPTSSIRQ